MEILTSVVERAVDYTIVPIGRQARYLIFYKGNFKMLADNVKDVQALRERIFHLVEEERGNGKEIERDVLNWLEEVNQVIERANQLQKDPRRANVRCSTCGFPNLILRHQLSRNATKIAKDVVEIQEKGNFNRVGYRPTLDGVGYRSSTTGNENYKTRELLKNDIVKALADPNSCNIGVYGLGGVGKTTLVEEVAIIAKQQKLFDKLVIAHVSKNPDLKTIQGEIADSLRLKFDEETIFGRAERLRERIKMEKRILVILDNIWTRLDLKNVGIPIGNEHNGCKLLMTSRNQDVLLQMDIPKDYTFKLGLMEENEALSLFQFMAGDVVKDSNLKDVATQVAKKCEGLPLRVVTVARAMRNKRDVQFWKDALRKLQSSDPTEMDALTYSALELSYNALEDEIRDIFLLFALVQGNDVEYFLKVAMGLEILKDVNTVEEARNKFYTVIRSLEVTCLLHDVKAGGVIQMHDFVHDFAISIARRDKHVFLRKHPHEEWPTKEFLKRCTQIALPNYQNDELPETIYCPNIKFFHLLSVNRSLEISDTFFEGMGSLTVLDLTSLNLSSLPTSFRFLTNLKTLCLNFCILENMDAIEALQNLKILCLRKSSMIKLPKEIGKLTQLRMLDLSNSGIEVVPPNILSSLIRLEELYMGNTSINWEDVTSTTQNENASIAELGKLPNLIALELQIRETWMLPRDLQLMFEKLERYKIVVGDVWEWSDIKDGTLNTLMLKLGTNIHLEHGIKALIKGVENLYLDDVDGIQNVLYELNGDGFPLLKHLHIQNNANMKHIVDSKERTQIHVSFPILETLVLHNLKNLECICHGPVSITSFRSLSVIKVKNCIQLKYILSFDMIKGLSCLSEIDLYKCNSVKEIVLGDNKLSANSEMIEFLQLRSLTLEHLETLDNFFSYHSTDSRSEQKYQGSESYVSSPFFNAQVVFPNLHTLKLSSLSNLNKIWDDNHHSMYNLTSLIVDNCDGLKYLFSSAIVASFKNLKQLEISSCPMMEEIIAKEERDNALKEVHFLKLEKIKLLSMDNLKTIWHRQFETVQMLEVHDCNKIAVVFPSSMQKTYNKLEMLKVKNCALVEAIFELSFKESSSVEDTTQLKEVVIASMPKLKKIWSGDAQEILSFQNLIKLWLGGCESLEHLLPFSVATRCSHLEKLFIVGCENMKEIVAEKEFGVNVAPIFEFNQLRELYLIDLGKLEGFYAKKHTLVCPSLKELGVCGCAKLNSYRTLSTRSSNFPDDNHQPSFIAEEVIPNLEVLAIDNIEASIILQAKNSIGLFTKMSYLFLYGYNNEDAFPYWFLQNAPSLQVLVVGQSFFEKIFQDEGQISEKTQTRLNRLALNELPKLQHICEEGSKVDPVLEFLQSLCVKDCSSLINLLPSSATLSHLEYLQVTNCNGLKNLFTSPTMRSLGKLASLKVQDCNSLEEVITGEENIHITLNSLQNLVLDHLPSLKQFCSKKCFLKLPLLDVVIVRECPRMKIFSEGYTSTPYLQKVKIKIAEDDEKFFWKGNLNDTITSMFEDKEVLRSNTL
ncbi:probable disease resistance protein At4g27220 [Trifolium pratense]|uniref:probable disease resistance protein At4g27220 n=1 Tax=Trifolium pratense TaxID=57577 RepID=UPI001E6930D0|nr:probable disease resistance protein At4g27220 [Trifolium pratense]XP_045806258.1 probable disease resistance protein At4g27220 [Trifolium pratense]XP_045806265.1 probable disease resistance protein At4g27220 [Trifolium pratense]